MNKLSTKTLKKLESVGNRLARSTRETRPTLAQYFVEDETAYFTNSYMGMSFQGVLDESLPLKGAAFSGMFPLDSVKRLIKISAEIENTVLLDVKETLKSIRADKKAYKVVDNRAHFEIRDGKAVICKGATFDSWIFDYRWLYEALLVADELKIKEFTVSIPENKIRPAWFMDDTSEYAFKMIIAPCRVPEKYLGLDKQRLKEFEKQEQKAA